MNLSDYFEQKAKVRELLLNYIDDESENPEEEYNQLTKVLNQEVENKFDLKEFLYLIYSITSNHYRPPYFFEKIEKVILYLKEQIIQSLSIFEILEIFYENKRVLLLLIETGVIQTDQPDFKTFLQTHYFSQRNSIDNFPVAVPKYRVHLRMNKIEYEEKNISNKDVFLLYFYPEIETIIDLDEKNKLLENLSLLYFDTENSPDFQHMTEFKEKRKIGENNSTICSLIRNDSIDDFIKYISGIDISISSKITLSIFETNEFLIENNNKTSLIEYAAFHGSVQIFKYLLLNGADLNSSLWLYAIHGKNSEIIHLLEENSIEPPENNFGFCLLEAVKCNHDDIADYIQNNFQISKEPDLSSAIKDIFAYIMMFNRRGIRADQQVMKKGKSGSIISTSFKYRNYYFIQNYINDESLLINSCEYDYYKIVENNLSKRNIEFDDHFKKLLQAASKNNNIDIVQILLLQPKCIIEEKCFKNCYYMRKITIPPSITVINSYSFENCESLVEIQLPSTLISIKHDAFNKCTSLQQITIPSSVTEIGKYCFSQCTSLAQVKIEASINELLESTFDGCSNLKEVQLPSSLTKIGRFCFNLCSSLNDITIPKSVNEIEKGAFVECSSLKKINLPSLITEIKDDAFGNCSSLIEITFPPSLTKIGKRSFLNCTSLKEISIPSSVNAIEMNAFFNCSSLEKIEFNMQSSLNYIASHSFEQCSSLKEISFPDSLNSFGVNVLNDCSSLKQIKISKSADITNLGIKKEDVEIINN